MARVRFSARKRINGNNTTFCERYKFDSNRARYFSVSLSCNYNETTLGGTSVVRPHCCQRYFIVDRYCRSNTHTLRLIDKISLYPMTYVTGVFTVRTVAVPFKNFPKIRVSELKRSQNFLQSTTRFAFFRLFHSDSNRIRRNTRFRSFNRRFDVETL